MLTFKKQTKGRQGPLRPTIYNIYFTNKETNPEQCSVPQPVNGRDSNPSLALSHHTPALSTWRFGSPAGPSVCS